MHALLSTFLFPSVHIKHQRSSAVLFLHCYVKTTQKSALTLLFQLRKALLCF